MLHKASCKKTNGIIFGRPQDEKYYEDYKEAIHNVMEEFDLENLPILYNLNFGHTEPKFILPFCCLKPTFCGRIDFISIY